jgi:hypothetical protein
VNLWGTATKTARTPIMAKIKMDPLTAPAQQVIVSRSAMRTNLARSRTMVKTVLAARMVREPTMATAMGHSLLGAITAKMDPALAPAVVTVTVNPLGTKTNMDKTTPIPGTMAPAMAMVFASTIATRLGTALPPVREMETVTIPATTMVMAMVVNHRF